MNPRYSSRTTNLIKLRRHVSQTFLLLFGKLRRAEHTFMVVAAIVIGVLGAFGAIAFRFLIRTGQSLLFTGGIEPVSGFGDMAWWTILCVPVIGGLLVGPIAHFFAREVRGSGIPEVMESVAVWGGSIRPRVVVAKAIAAAITIGSGGSAGREGPIVQIGSAIGSSFGQLLTVSARRMRTFVACGASAGIAATFNAPIAGALFSVEIIMGDFAVPQFSPIVISSVVATVVSRHFIGDFPAFQVPAYEMVSFYEFLPYVSLGILAGLIAVLFIQSVYRTQDLFELIKMPPYLKPALGGLVVGTIALKFPQVLGVGYESINDALWGRDVQWLLAVLILLKIAATSATLGSGGSGGIFAPSLFIGAMLGGLIGEQAHLLFPEATASAGAYALVGMGAVVAGTTHAPITAILTIFELTNDYLIIPPLMVSCIIAVLLATYLKKESMYTMKLVKRGINIFEGRDVNVLRGLRVSDAVSRQNEPIPENHSFEAIMRRVITSSDHEFFVVDEQKRLVGSFSMDEIKGSMKDEPHLSALVVAVDIARPPVTCLYPDDSLDLVMHQFGRYNVDELPVLDSKASSELIGSVKRQEIIETYNREILKIDLVGGMHSIVTAVNKERDIELAEGYKLVEMDPPNGFVGKSIGEIDIRSRFGVQVILVRRPSQETNRPTGRPGAMPSPDYVIQSGDKLLVLGDEKDIERIRSH